MSKRSVLAASIAALLLGVVAPAAAEAAPAPAPAPAPAKLTLASYTASVAAPEAPAELCDYNFLQCGYLTVEATFSGLDRFPRPAGEVGPPEGGLSGSAEIRRTYGCAAETGKRLHRYDTTVTETVGLNTRRGTGFTVPRTGDTLTATTYAFFDDRQPGNCPAGTTATTYKIVAKKIELELDFYVDGLPAATYKAPARAQWVGAVPTPTPAAS
ncbi:hypothetical protein [Nakamurella deserti]|uniref:hypothetical protein n=1 Tax=Nakamurella deserti TaxID=2164074 RepID=UPI000DBE8935|nr:hypothetical protein [Nakamurella deserti]